MTLARITSTALVAFVIACGGDSKTPATLDGAIGKPPVFVPSALGERSTALTSDDISNVGKFSTYTWHLSTAQPWTAIDAFYRAQWPGAGREETEDGVSYRNPPLPEGDDPLGESQSVSIHKAPKDGRTSFDVSEDVFAEKRR